MALCGKAVRVILRNLILLLAMAVALTTCTPAKYHEEERGYKGAAEIDPWLGAERFLGSYGHEVSLITSWHPPEPDEAVWFVPAHVIANETFARQLDNWMRNGGHLVCLVDYSTAASDWDLYSNAHIDPAFEKLLGWHGFSIESDSSWIPPSPKSPVKPPVSVQFRGKKYETGADSGWNVSVLNATSGEFATAVVGQGRMTVVCDARLFRNRWIDEKQHAELLKALTDAAPARGSIVFVRAATLSLWKLLWDRAWAVVLGGAIVLAFWLWKNLPRFGPLEAAEAPSPMRGYDHHLEALGDFQWRLDKAATMLGPIREEIIEKAHRLLVRIGRQDADIFQVLAERAGISRERAHRSLAEPAPADAAVFTRTVADLQAIRRALD
ncbi:DUF4350 domain-containing protein [Luteolibacter sp. LG18]|uniref:DUF4350 domain-containing protein n=1 Tax=Luteolibacter sp. LG18 TaxID=2819286 RepID=UPI0030C66939